jgi:hypothetical protein
LTQSSAAVNWYTLARTSGTLSNRQAGTLSPESA